MTLKEALKERKKAATKKKDNGFWAVRVEVEVVEQIHIVEFVKASSAIDAQKIALKQFERRTPELIHDRAAREWRNKNRYSLQHQRIAKTSKRKKFIVSEKQRKILKELVGGKYLERTYSRWYIVNPTNKTVWSKAIPSVSVDSLFQKGLLIDLTTANMSDQEIAVQEAIGSLPELKVYTINKAVVKTLGLRL